MKTYPLTPFLYGEVHKDQIAYDAQRDGILKARGLQILRIPNAEVRNNLDGVLESIRAYINT